MKDDGWHKDGYRIFVQPDGVCHIWTDERVIAETANVTDALEIVDLDIDESEQEQAPATVPHLAAVEIQDAVIGNADPDDEQTSKRLTEQCSQYHITRRRGKTNGKPWRLMRGTEVINDFKTEEAALAAKDQCIRDVEAIVKLDPSDFDNQWVDVKGDGNVFSNRLYKLHGLLGQAGGKYNAFFDGSIGLAAPGGTPGGATCKNLEEAKAVCKKHYIEKVIPIGDENARFLKDAIEAKGMRFTSPHFIHFDIEKIGYLGHRNVLTFASKHHDLIDMLVEGASAEVLDRLRRRLGVQKEAAPSALKERLATLNPIEKAQMFRKTKDEGKTMLQVAEIFGITPMELKNQLKLLLLTPEEQEKVASGQWKAETGYTLVDKRDRGEKTETTSPRKAKRKARNEAR